MRHGLVTAATVLFASLLIFFGASHLQLRSLADQRPALEPVRGEERAAMAPAPHVPPPIARTYPMREILDVEIKEHTKSLADGVTYTYWTFGGDTPGQFVRVREGDLVEVRLRNHPDNEVWPRNRVDRPAPDPRRRLPRSRAARRCRRRRAGWRSGS